MINNNICVHSHYKCIITYIIINSEANYHCTEYLQKNKYDI